jgi:hypothetical protein
MYSKVFIRDSLIIQIFQQSFIITPIVYFGGVNSHVQVIHHLHSQSTLMLLNINILNNKEENNPHAPNMMNIPRDTIVM